MKQTFCNCEYPMNNITGYCWRCNKFLRSNKSKKLSKIAKKAVRGADGKFIKKEHPTFAEVKKEYLDNIYLNKKIHKLFVEYGNSTKDLCELEAEVMEVVSSFRFH
jgi:hypothetical protein